MENCSKKSYSESDDGNINRAILEKIIHIQKIDTIVTDEMDCESHLSAESKIEIKCESQNSKTNENDMS